MNTIKIILVTLLSTLLITGGLLLLFAIHSLSYTIVLYMFMNLQLIEGLIIAASNSAIFAGLLTICFVIFCFSVAPILYCNKEKIKLNNIYSKLIILITTFIMVVLTSIIIIGMMFTTPLISSVYQSKPYWESFTISVIINMFLYTTIFIEIILLLIVLLILFGIINIMIFMIPLCCIICSSCTKNMISEGKIIIKGIFHQFYQCYKCVCECSWI